MTRTVWFHREYERLYGGHVKHSHYFEHVRRMPGFVPRISFTEVESLNGSLARERAELWPAAHDTAAERWEPGRRDVLFLGGVDWRYLFASGLKELTDPPRINLVQHVRHAHEGTELHRYLEEPAIRICVSEEVADAVAATGRARGPILTIPNGIDVAPFEPDRNGSPARFEARSSAVTIIGYKQPELARDLAGRLDAEGVRHRLVTELLDRSEFLDLLADSRVAVCLPRAEEGFYLPALEAMASGCLLVTLDCIGNRTFCRHERGCLVAEPDPDALCAATKRAVAASPSERVRMHRHARDTAVRYSLDAERSRFHAVLGDVDRLWRDTQMEVAAGTADRLAQSEPGDHRPMLGFMVVGVQRCGTTALARFLSRHPEIAMSSRKEMHLFDRPDYSPGWSVAQIDARYGLAFKDAEGVRIRGEATPIYLFFPEIARRAQAVQPGAQADRAAARPRAARHFELLPREEPGQGEQTPVAGVAAGAMEIAALPRCACLPVADAGVRISPTGSLQPAVAQSLSALRSRSGPGRPHPRPRGAARCRPGACLPIPGRERAGSDRPGSRQSGGPRRTDAPCLILVVEAVLPGGVRADACNVSFGPHADRRRRLVPGILTADPR